MSTKYGFYAQYGEDVILARIFAGRAKGVAVEVGAFDGVNASNSYHFERKGWDCVLVEPNPDLAGLIRQSRPRAQLFECAVGRKYGKMVLQIPEGDETLASLNSNADELRRVASKKTGNRRAADAPEQPIKDIEVAVMPLDDILEKSKVSGIDFITIDVEGFEMDVLRGFSLARWKPRIVILEDNDFGASDAVTDYMEAKGYRRFRNTVCNDWYGRKDDRALFGTRQVVFTEIRKTFTDCKRVVGRHARRIVRLMKEG